MVLMDGDEFEWDVVGSSRVPVFARGSTPQLWHRGTEAPRHRAAGLPRCGVAPIQQQAPSAQSPEPPALAVTCGTKKKTEGTAHTTSPPEPVISLVTKNPPRNNRRVAEACAKEGARNSQARHTQIDPQRPRRAD